MQTHTSPSASSMRRKPYRPFRHRSKNAVHRYWERISLHLALLPHFRPTLDEFERSERHLVANLLLDNLLILDELDLRLNERHGCGLADLDNGGDFVAAICPVAAE